MTDLLVEAANPKRIIMFGSLSRGEVGEDSGFDGMVVEEVFRIVPRRWCD